MATKLQAQQKTAVVIGGSMAGLLAARVLADSFAGVTICERDTTFLRELNSAVWSPVYTQGITNETIDYLHGQGRQVITWTVDLPGYLEQYITQTNIDGIDTDYTTLAAYYFWKQ